LSSIFLYSEILNLVSVLYYVIISIKAITRAADCYYEASAVSKISTSDRVITAATD